MSVNPEKRSNGNGAPTAPIGVRTRAVVGGHWILVGASVAIAVAAVVFVLLPGWLGPVRPIAPLAKPVDVRSPAPAPAPAQAPTHADAPAPAQMSAPSAAPVPAQAQGPEQAPEAAETPPPESPVTPAAKSPARADRADGDQRFAQLMSRGLAHADRAEWTDAEQAFRAATQLRPDDRAAADGLARAQAGLERHRLTELRSEAERSEAEERWADALAAYRRALAIDPTLEFAKRGRERSERMATLHAELEALLADPRRLYSPPVREAARKTLAAAQAAPAGGARLAQISAQLDATLHRATTPIAVRLTSDDLTDVTIYRVGPLGRFDERDFELTPGTYTVVGSRAGYKDVRVELTVDPDAPAPRVFIACREPV